MLFLGFLQIWWESWGLRELDQWAFPHLLLLLVTPVTLLSAFGLAQGAKPLLLALSAATLLYAPFIAVAIWRSAGNYRGKSACRLLAKGSVLFVALQVAVGLALG